VSWLTVFEAPADALAVLTAMITPAVLISACAALIFSTATRMGRVIDRVRFLSGRFEELSRHPEADDLAAERLALIYSQLERQARRARLIQRALVAFYTALGVFVATSLAIAVVSAVARDHAWVPVAMGLAGALYLLYGSALLIVESRMALAAVTSEIDFLSKLSRTHAGEELIKSAERLLKQASGGPFTWFEKMLE
jgi:threonine/homoserine/homoserine lactone efflux protein